MKIRIVEGKILQKFNETGNYYYGSRYYDPTISIWLSVDPLAHKYPHITPYNFVENNPIILVDPDGKGPYVYEEVEGGGYQKVENMENDGGEDFHTFIDLNGTVHYYNTKTEERVTITPDQISQMLENAKFPHRLGTLGIGFNLEYAVPVDLLMQGEPVGNGISFDLMADADNNLQLLKTTKTPDKAMKNQFGLSIGLQFSFTTGTGDNPNPLNADLIGRGFEWGSSSGPLGYSPSSNIDRTYQMHTVPLNGRFSRSLDFGITRWKTNTQSLWQF